MRPMRLTMRALGPYAREEVIDFAALGDRTLFLITGQTGSGKTTILDAMCYALYGATSGEVRSAEQMRSDHADPAVVTEVIFDFSLGKDLYRVRRSPQQERPKKRGEGTVTQQTEACLWSRTKAKDESDDGKPLATKIGEVNQQVQGLLGFTSEQFRQVVLLPQGDFVKFIMADSKDRESVLETLFGTGIYRLMEQALRDRQRGLRDQLEEVKRQRSAQLEAVGVESPEELEEAHKECTKDLGSLAKQLTAARKKREEAEQRRADAQAVADKFEERDAAVVANAELAERGPEIEKMKSNLGRGQKAADLADAEARRDERATELRKAEVQLAEARGEFREAEKLGRTATKALAAEKKRDKKRNRLREEIAKYESLKVKVGKLSASEEKLSDLADHVEKHQKDCRQLKEDTDGLRDALKTQRRSEAESEKEAVLLKSRRAEARRAKEILEDRRELEEARKESKSEAKRLREAAKGCEAARARYEKCEAEIESMQRAFEEGSAGVLAKALKPGTPCPVCGSRDHPAPAQVAAGLPDQSALAGKRKDLVLIRKELKAAEKGKGQLERATTRLEAKAEQLAKTLGKKAAAKISMLTKEAKSADKALAEAEEADEAVKAAAKQIPVLERRLSKLGEKQKLAEKELGKRMSELDKLEGKVKAERDEVPFDLRTSRNLAKATKVAAKEYSQLLAALEKAEESTKQTAEALAAQKATVSSAEKQFRQCEGVARKAEDEFASRLAKAGFKDEEAYADAKLKKSELKRFDRSIRTYEKELAVAAQRLDRARKDVKGRKRPEIDTAKKAVDTAVEAEEGLSAEKGELQGRLDLYAKCQKALAVAAKKSASLEKKYRVVGRVAEVANGENPLRLTFQRFVLGAVLDDVLIAASERLRIMSKGRYALQRGRDPQDRRRASGLDLEVLDAWTGETRPVKTLSGGESFLAALSLALGLAGVVQSYSGGIRLETMFIDEGFGSLDPEALDQSMQALVDLQESGRLVGIISHVSELREMVATRLEIERGKSGSRAKFILT